MLKAAVKKTLKWSAIGGLLGGVYGLGVMNGIYGIGHIHGANGGRQVRYTRYPKGRKK